mmetsp:Transcript_28461/g.75009  ORF Transcript_28461/g.75009 Transcript_28461/m.75009 type:complete len:114 (+) Transcript_28461:360-701(+)
MCMHACNIVLVLVLVLVACELRMWCCAHVFVFTCALACVCVFCLRLCARGAGGKARLRVGGQAVGGHREVARSYFPVFSLSGGIPSPRFLLGAFSGVVVNETQLPGCWYVCVE